MSKQKYEALIEAWVKSHNEYVYYERDCMAFIKDTIILEFGNYLGQSDCVRLFNVFDGFDEYKKPKWKESIELWSDTFLHFGVYIGLINTGLKRTKYILLHLAEKVDVAFSFPRQISPNPYRCLYQKGRIAVRVTQSRS